MSADKDSLASQLSGTVLVPGDQGYEESIKRWGENSEKKAAFVVFVENAKAISKTVSFPSPRWGDKMNTN